MLHRLEFQRLCRARDRLRASLEEPLRISEVAREAQMSPYRFIRQFHALFGQTPLQVRIDARLEHAQELLLREVSVTEVCMEVGFSSLGSFSARFRERVGVAPSTYRRLARPMIQVPGLVQTAAPGCFSLMWGWPT